MFLEANEFNSALKDLSANGITQLKHQKRFNLTNLNHGSEFEYGYPFEIAPN